MKIRKNGHVHVKDIHSKKSCGNEFNGKAFFSGLIEYGPVHAYLALYGGDVCKKIIGSECCDKEHDIRIVEIDGIPTTVLVCKKRYVMSLMRCKTYTQAYNYLMQKFADNDIKNFFYDIWFGNHNYMVAKKMAREQNDIRRLMKAGIKIQNCKMSSKTGMSSRQAARTYGVI